MSCYAISRRAVEKSQERLYEVNIDWEKLYPFDYEFSVDVQQKQSNFTKTLLYTQEKVIKYTSEKIPCYYKFVETSKVYEDIIDWNMTPILKYNPVIKLYDGYLVGLTDSRDVSQNV